MEDEIIWLDKNDKKILAALNETPRASYSDIAKRVRLSKEVVNYRVNRLTRRGIIRDFVTIIGLGYWSYKILMEFSKIDSEEEIFSYLSAHENVNWVTPCSGVWDVIFCVMAKDPKQFDEILRDILSNIGEHVIDYKVGISSGSQTFGHTYILGSIKEPKKVRRNVPGQFDFDEKDKLILRAIQNDARISLTDIYKKTKIPIDTIRYHIKRLEQNNVIKTYRMILDSGKLGYHRYELLMRCINLSDSIIEKFREYAKMNPHVEYFSKCVGGWDIEMTVHFKSSEKLHAFIIALKKEFGDHIQKFETLTLFKTYNHTYNAQELK